MDPITFGLVTFALLLVLLLLSVPVAYALAMTVLIMMTANGATTQALSIATTAFDSLDSIELVAVPMFVFMGAIVSASPAGADLYRALHRLLPVRGGLGISTVVGCTLFAALSGSSPATATAIGSTGIPEMIRRGYPPGLATGIIVGGGTLGIVIPPSVVLLIYGIVTGTSIGRLFLAGLLPGAMVATLFAAYIWWQMRSARDVEVETDAEARQAFRRVLPMLTMVVTILVMLYGGWATPSEIASVGAVLSLVLVSVIYRITDWRVWRQLLLKTVRETTLILLIAAFSYYLGQLLAFHGTVGALTQGLLGLSDNRWVTLLLVSLIMLLMGKFLPPFAIIVIVAPMFLPFVVTSGLDPVWFGVLVTVNMEMGLITPPVGINLFIAKAIAPDVPMKDIILGALPFLGLLVVASLILCVFPQIALFLPNLVMGH